jgi:predicted transcriptional regulator
MARILNNGTNLRIIEKLKVKPFYPGDLASEMSLSEPFIVRRLKAMEECGIAEGKWETQGSRKVKRYYLKDIKL